MSRLFISHSSQNDDWALALKEWLVREGWSATDDIFLDVDPERGITAGQRWAEALKDATTRCEAVLFLVSEAWLASKWCHDEYQLANNRGKKLFALLIDDIALDRLPGGLTAQWQVVHLKGEPAERFLTVHPHTGHQSPVHIAKAALTSLKRGLDKAGIGAETFELQPDQHGLFGWRAVYRGLEALEPEDAAVFFGRNADIVRGIDALRGLATLKPPLLLVVLGASGAGKSSFLRAGLWPRLLRDDSQWLPLRPIRAGPGGHKDLDAIEGGEGLLEALEEVHRRFALTASRAELRKSLATPETFVALLRGLRQAAARRALLAEPPFPLPLLCLDQGEEFFARDAGAASATLLRLARAAADAGEALLLVTIRSDSYGLMQTASTLEGIDQQPLSLGPVPQGEIARIIREPAEILRRKAGPSAPLFDAAVVARLQAEIEGEADALPLLAFVLQRLMREHAGAGVIGLAELEATGGVGAAIESEAEAALADAGIAPERIEQRDALRRLFIPRLARIDRTSKAPQRRASLQSQLPTDLLPLAQALTRRRLLVIKLVAREGDTSDAATIEVAHEALLRRWPTLTELLAEDRDALLLLDGVLNAAADWRKAGDADKADYLAHRGSRLAEAHALAARGADWQREIAPAQAYLAACQAREVADREEKEAAILREKAQLAEVAVSQKRQASLQRRARWALAAVAVIVLLASGLFAALLARYEHDIAERGREVAVSQQQVAESQAEVDEEKVALQHQHANLLGELADIDLLRGDLDGALRFATNGAVADRALPSSAVPTSPAAAELATAVLKLDWQTVLAGEVNSAAFSPDGTRIVTASSDKTAHIWDTVTGKELMVLRGHENVVHSAAFSPDGTRIVTASGDKTTRIWNAITGKELLVLRGHEDDVSSAAFSPDGTRIVTASRDRTARVWDAATGKEITILNSPAPDSPTVLNWVNSAAFSPDGTRIVTASRDQTASVWDAATGKELLVLAGHENWVNSAAFSPDGRRIVTASLDATARVWDAATGKELMVLAGHDRMNSAAFSRDGTRIVTASRDKTARIWDAATGKELTVLHGHENDVISAAFSPDGTRIATASEDHTVRIWDTAVGTALMVLNGHEDIVNSAAFSRDGTRIVTASEDNTARVWDTGTGKELIVLRGHEDNTNSAAFNPDGRRIVTASRDKTARIWDTATGKQLLVLRGHEDDVSSAAFSPDGTRVVTASNDNTARIWDAVTGKELLIRRRPDDGVGSVAFSPDGTRVVTASLDQARIWDAATGKDLVVLQGHEDYVSSAVFSPDGTRIVTTSRDKTARIWDAATGKELTVLRGHEDLVSWAAFSPDGMRVVTASYDNTARIWDATAGRELTVVRGHESAVTSAAFSPDGTRIVTASFDHTARIWDVHFATMSTQKLIVETCTRRLRGISTMTRDEMRLAGYSDSEPPIDVCAGVH